MGRHTVEAAAKKPVRPLVISAIAAAAVIGVVSTGAYLWVGGHLNPLFASAEDGCETEDLVVVADISVAPVVEDLAEVFDKSRDGCVKTEVRAQEAADTAALIAGGGLNADIWIPDSSVWLDRAAATAQSLGRNAPQMKSKGSIATSPIVFAAAASQTEQIASEPVTWARVLGGSLQALLPDPEASAASLAGLLALKSKSSPDDPRQFAGAMIALGKTIPASTGAAFSSVSTMNQPTVVISSERLVAEYNLKNGSEPLSAAYPVDGSVALDYPYIALGELKGTRAKLIGAFEGTLRHNPKAFRSAGFRALDGTGELKIAGLSMTPPTPAAGLDGAAQVEILRQWGVLTLRSRMLAVIDVSGSMEEPADNGLRRIDVFQQAALGAMQKFSGEVEMGVWVFSTQRNGDLDYEDLVPIGPLADAGHTQQIAGVIASLPDRLGGATGLYDTTLAAVQRVRETYDPEKINSVLIITDGRNEDDNGIDLDTLLAELAKIAEENEPVPVIMIGFGPDTDMDAMQRIAKSTGGAAYSAFHPEDLGVVLVDALSQRSCRPDCG
ncbi:substrate-binding domain-containing protein [Agromyces intestinalis]|uniref:substrate-binding domain-containing protein n=1 Tax=Agromyces intestinalis TaxID=2592652 RepID=UPI00143D0565|nr:substrate-binding domain-containing protein [Agromyces intestinalis]